MLLPHLINVILAQTTPSGGPLVRLGATELTSPSFAPNTIVVLEASPATNIYGLLLFRITFGDTPINTFTLDLYHAGALMYTGVLTQEDVDGGLDMFANLRAQWPITLRLTNNDPIVRHAFRARLHYLILDDVRDWDMVMKLVAVHGGRTLP